MACLVLGACVGVLAGMLGIGGGLVIVPALVFLLPLTDTPAQYFMPIAIATSLASIIITSSSAALMHRKNGNVPWLETKKVLVFISIGSLIGALIASSLPADVLKKIFAVFVIFIASYMIASLKVERKEITASDATYRTIGGLTGVIASILGIAGGAILVPALSYFGTPIRKAIGMATVCGVFVAIFGVVGFVYTGWGNTALPAWSLGYVYLPALLGIVLTSAFFAPIGVKLAANLPVATLKKFFAGFLILVALKMMFG